MNRIIGIYKITSPSGKVYIGQSSNIYVRFRDYNKINNSKGQVRLYNSFLKYGIENHHFEIITECEECDLNLLERYYQEEYDVLNSNGLNCEYVKTNSISGKMSEETKKKISLANKGRKFSKEQRLNMSLGQKGKKMPNRTDEFKKHMSNIMSGKKKPNGFKPHNVKKVINTLSGEIYDSVKIASEKNNVARKTMISYLKNKVKSVNHFKYYE